VEVSVTYKGKKVLVCNLNAFAIMGEEIIFADEYHYTVTVKSDVATVLVIDKEKLIAKFKPEIVD
jgi:hypothetical protein